MCATCKRYHPTSLHEIVEERFKQKEAEKSEKSKSTEITAVSNKIKINRSFIGDTHNMIVPVWLYLNSDGSNRVLVYALLDDQSDVCFISKTTLDKVKATGPQVHLQVATVIGEETVLCTKVQGLVIQGVYEQKEVSLPFTYSRDNIPARRDQIPRPETANNWPHLTRIADKLMPYDPNVEIGLLIGLSCTKALKAKEMIPGNENDPFARRTVLGWGIIGKLCGDRGTADGIVQIHRTMAQEVVIKNEKKVSFLIVPTQVKEVIEPQEVKKMFEQDFNDEPTDDVSISHEDKLFMTKMKEGIYKPEQQHYEMPLPLKHEKVKLENNKHLAVHRLERLKGKFRNDKKYYQDYVKSVHDMITNGYAEAVPAKELARQDGFVWCIPHHGVYHPKKPDKLRVVFDCSASYKKQSLNIHLLQGPDLANSFIGVLCRFHQEEIAFCM